MAFVLKIKHEESLRRFTVSKTSTGTPDLTFDQLDAKIRDFFGIPLVSKLVVTYTDKDGDVVTMAEDQDLQDACVLQGLNPLRLTVVAPDVQPKHHRGGSLPETLEAVVTENLKSMFDLKELKDIKDVKSVVGQVFKDDRLKGVVGPILHEHLKALFGDVVKEEMPEVKKSDAAAESSSAPRKPASTPAATGSDHVETNGVYHPNVQHQNVQCDGCGMSPIVGPRFKSIIKDDYDLCVRCFQVLPKGSEADYTRYDRPMQRHHYFPGFGVRGAGRCPALRVPSPYKPPLHGYRSESRGADRFDHGLGIPNTFWGSKPDGRFVCDATIPDGTEVNPGTAFVKIWRLRNSGKVPWVHGTQLVRVGGDELGTVSAVTLQLPENGVQPDAEVDVAVDLVAPEKPGRYVSYWRLMTPSGAKFGHRVWALIQVTPRVEPEPTPVVVDDVDSELDEDAVVVADAVVVEADVADDIAADVAADVVKVEEDEGVKVEKDVTEVDGFSVVENVPTVVEVVELENDGLEKLESMGFKDKKLNLELLEKNAFDVQRTLDDLVSSAEWDPILEELEEMGFYDSEMNRRLMFKNKGSVKHVVKDLVKLYKEPKQPTAA